MTNYNVNKLKTDFNTSPWYDDYDETKNFHRILYKAGRVAVQSRELNQTQAIFQDQIKRFADHIFVEGTIVSGGEFIFSRNLYYVKIENVNSLNNTVNVNDFIGQTITGQNSQVSALVDAVSESTNADPKTLYVYFKSSGTDGATSIFAQNEEVVASNGLKFTVKNVSDPVGKMLSFTIKSGVVFAKGHFINFDEQNIILSKYDTTPNVLVGFEINEDIVDYVEDYTLLDPAQGAPNYTAPGADRLKLTATLKMYNLDDTSMDSFIELFKMKEGILYEKYDRTQYSEIRNELARRTYDQSGNFYTNGLQVSLREHLNTGNNNGVYVLSNGGDYTKLSVGISRGQAYIKGYDYETLNTTLLTTTKGIDFESVQNQPITIDSGNYIYINELIGSINVNIGSSIDLYNQVQSRLTNKNWGTAAPLGTKIGTAKVKAYEWVSGTKGSPSGKYKLYLIDVKISSGSFSDVKSIYIDNNSASDVYADVVLDSGKAILYETNFKTAVYPISSNSIKTLRNSDGVIDITQPVQKTIDVNIPTTGIFTLNSNSLQPFNFSVGSLNNALKSKLQLTVNTAATVALSGNVNTTSGSSTITGSGTYFSRLNIGDRISIAGVSGVYYISNITNNTSLSVSGTIPSTVSNAAITKNYYAGDMIDLNTLGYTGNAVRSVYVNSNTSITITLNETLSSSISGSITLEYLRSSAKEGSKILRSNRYVRLDCSVVGTTGPFNLGISDVFKLKSVRKNSSQFTSNTQGSDVSSFFKLDNGQKDDLYDHAKIINRGLSLSPSDYLLVEFDYFYPNYTQGYSYFSVDSYPIDDDNITDTTIKTEQIPIYVSQTSGNKFDLKNCIDMRPVKINTAIDATDVSSSSINPITSETFVYIGDGLGISTPNSNMSITYSYYMGRKDLVVIDNQGAFRIIKGVPNVNPVTPNVPDNTMSLATLNIAPYPSLVSDEAASIGRLDLANSINKSAYKRYTMKDIGVLDNRLSNLEYYTALTLLEKRTLDLKIVDDNGLDRFKSGIFVDGFNNHLLGDLNNPDYTICVDSSSGEIRPMFEKDVAAISYKNGNNIRNNSGVVTVDYTETQYSSQPYATTVRNTAGFYWAFDGKINLYPASDFWTDVDMLPSIQITDDSSAIALQSLATSLGVNWNDWQTTITGVNVSSNSSTLSNGVFSTTNTATTTTTNYNTSRTGTQYVVNTSTNTQSLGTRVVSSALVPYMRSIPIKVFAYGLKPNTKIYAFFDNEDVTNYVIQTNSNFSETYNNSSVVYGNLKTDNNGYFYGIFILPCNSQKKFTVGTKNFKLTDVFDNGDGSITSASVDFTSQGLNNQVQDTYLTTTYATASKQTLYDSFTSSTSTTAISSNTTRDVPNELNSIRSRGDIRGHDPIAQTFVIGDESPYVFLTGVDLFFQTKDTTLGLTVQIRETDSAGNITNSVIPYSEVYVSSSNVNISTNGSLATRIEFKAPICLTSGNYYALAIIPENSNPNYRIWTAKLGGTDIVSNTRVSVQPASGNLVVSSDSNNWQAIQDEDIKYVFYRAKFSTNAASMNVSNSNDEYFNVSNTNGNWSTKGEPVLGEYKLTLNSSPSVSIGNTVFNNNISGTITSINSNIITVFSTSYNDMINGSVIIKDGSNNIVFSGLITNVVRAKGTLERYSSDTNYMKLTNTSNTFRIGEKLLGKYSGNTATISAFKSKYYSLIDFETSTLELIGSTVDWTYKGLDRTYTMDGSFNSLMVNDNMDIDIEKQIIGYSNEMINNSGNKSFLVNANLLTYSDYISPVIDLNRTFLVMIHNIINNDNTNEDDISGGKCVNKYISQKIQLKDSMDAEDLRVILSCYRPVNSEIKVYAKLINGEDSETFNSKKWIELNRETSNEFYSSSSDKNDFKEYQWSIPQSYMTGPNNEFTYTTTSGATFSTYKQFQIKILLLGTNSALVPRASDLSCIALQL